MSHPTPEQASVAPGTGLGGDAADLTAPLGAVPTPDRDVQDDDLPPVSSRFIWLLVFAVLGVYVAFVTPIALSLATRVQDLAPDHEEYLGYIIGVGSLMAVLSGPVVGALSDGTRSRWGRRRPFFVLGGVIGMIALGIMAAAPNLAVLALGWMLAQLGWNNVIALLLALQADKLPESQRGKVAGLTGFATMVGPVVGAGMGAALVSSTALLFLVPGAFGFAALLLFVALVRDEDNRHEPAGPPFTLRSILGKFLFSPSQHRDFSWNWVGRFVFMIGVTFNTTFLTFFLAQRADKTVEAAAGVIAVVSIVGVLASAVGAIGGGVLSDRLQRRRSLVMLSGVVFAAGTLLMATSSGLALAFTGAVIANLGLGVFSAVDQALVLDVLPDKKTDAGRFVGINQFSVTVPQAVAPLIAPAILTISVAGGDKNYSLLFAVAGVCTLVGGFIVLTRVKSAR